MVTDVSAMLVEMTIFRTPAAVELEGALLVLGRDGAVQGHHDMSLETPLRYETSGKIVDFRHARDEDEDGARVLRVVDVEDDMLHQVHVDALLVDPRDVAHRRSTVPVVVEHGSQGRGIDVGVEDHVVGLVPPVGLEQRLVLGAGRVLQPLLAVP